jgi:hypothetical protein
MFPNRPVPHLLSVLLLPLLTATTVAAIDLPPIIMGQQPSGNGIPEFPFPTPDSLRGLHCNLITYDFDYYDEDDGVGPVVFSLTPGSPGTIDSNGVYVYMPSLGDIGQQLSFTARACRPAGNCTQATVTLVVANDPPHLTNLCDTIITMAQGNSESFDLDIEDSCAGDPKSFFVANTGGFEGTLLADPLGPSLQISPSPSDFGFYTVRLGITDFMDTSFCNFRVSIPGDNAITVDTVLGLQGGAMTGGSTSELRLRVTIDPDIAGYLTGYSNGFRVYSPDGARWDTAFQTYLAPWPLGTPNGFDNTALPKYGLDGVGDDTLAFAGFVFFSDHGALPGYDQVAWSVFVTPSQTLLNDGRTICLDTVMNFPPSNSWLWNDSTLRSYYPTWDGPHCFTIVSEGCCSGITGNVNNDPGDVVNLSDLTQFVNHLFVTFAPLGCRPEANTSGDNNCALTLTDLTALVNYLFVNFQPPATCSQFNEENCY